MLGSLGGILIILGPPLSFVVGLVAVAMDRSRVWARLGLIVSFITFALWLTAVLCGGFND